VQTTAIYRGFERLLPQSLQSRLMLLTAACLVASILGYGAYTAKQQTELARQTITAQMSALAQNLATINAYFLVAEDAASIEAITVQTATVPGIFSVLVTDMEGKPLSEVVNQNGKWSPRFGTEKVSTPPTISPTITAQPKASDGAKRDFLAGGSGQIYAWHPVTAGSHLGWVRVSYRLDSFDQTARNIWTQAMLVIVLSIGSTLVLLGWLLRPPMRALQIATQFAAELDSALGKKMPLPAAATLEIKALGDALNVVSERLFAQNNDLNNQKFALDQHAIVSITDLNGAITYANDRFCAISGYSQSELIGQNHRMVKSGFHAPEIFEDLWRTISKGDVWNGEIKNRRRDGSHYWVSATIVPLMDSDGLPQQYVGIRTDITAIKELEQSLQEAKAVAEAATLAKSQFLANMSHEIRTPMNAILGMLGLLQNTDLSTRQLDYANKTESAAKSLLGLLNDILDFSKIDAGKMELDLQPFRFDSLMRDLSVILSASVGNKAVEVLFDIDPSIPTALTGDSMRLQQVLINLGGNAIKFTEHGEVLVQVKVLAHSASEVTLRIAVCDSGIGIAPENQKHIFDGFSQAEASTTRRFGGTGLGLSICKRLVALMGGELSLDSALGQGSTFHFSLTLGVAGQIPEESALPGERLLAPLSVLVVDDNPTARTILLSMAQSWGWQVDVADTGAAAIALATQRAHTAQAPYQAIFMDWEMPGLDGWETIERLQQISHQAPSPITVMVTAHGREMLSRRNAQDQARLNGFLVKPITASMLFDAVADARVGHSGLRQHPRSKANSRNRLAGMRVLLVEDNMINQQVARELLDTEGAVVVLAENGQLGVAAVAGASIPFDVVLMDIQMPVMDGYTAARAIRQDLGLGLGELPIIAMTANAMASDRTACLAAGMNDHVGKPFDLAYLVKVLKKHTQHTTPPGAAADEHAAATPPRPDQDASPTRLPEPDAVDVEDALERLGDNAELYGKILVTYLDELRVLPDQLDTMLQGGDLTGAGRLLHTLKGLSATVGASYMSAVARAAEARVKGGDTGFDQDALRAQFRAAVGVTAGAMGRIAQRFVQAAAPGAQAWADAATNAPEVRAGLDALTRSALVADVHRLQGLLKSSDMAALGVQAKLRQTYACIEEDLAPLDAAIAAFDFAQAVVQCDCLFRKFSSIN
jgi:PAS domain S-box-containing protein